MKLEVSCLFRICNFSKKIEIRLFTGIFNHKCLDPIKKTITVEKRNEVCFSLKPVNACPKGFENADSEGKQEEVNFACFARSSTDAQRYLREARENVLALDDESQDYTEKVTVPRRCIKY